MRGTLIKDLMTEPIQRIGKQAPLRDVARIMREQDIGCVAIAVDGRIEGLVTDRDIVTRGVAEGRHPNQSPISEVMTRGVWGVRSDDPLDRATKLMSDKKVRRLLVYDDDNQPVGVVSLGDIAQHGGSSADTVRVLEQVAGAAPTPV